jgi:hypothetical protein
MGDTNFPLHLGHRERERISDELNLLHVLIRGLIQQQLRRYDRMHWQEEQGTIVLHSGNTYLAEMIHRIDVWSNHETKDEV